MLHYDQVIPGSTLLGLLNADHWRACCTDYAEPQFYRFDFLNKNDHPREALIEADPRFVTEELKHREINEK